MSIELHPLPQGPLPGLWYLASPYTDVNPYVKETRFRQVCTVASRLMNEGWYLYSPIAMCHPIAIAGSLPGDWAFWGDYDRTVIGACAGYILLTLAGWELSKGVSAELRIAAELGKPTYYLAEDIVLHATLTERGRLLEVPPTRVEIGSEAAVLGKEE